MTTVDWNLNLGVRLVLISSCLLLLGATGGAVATQAIDITGEFEGTFDGYEPDQNAQSHIIQVEGGFEITGEDAQDVVITVQSGPETVLDQSTVESFVEGERDISFDRTDRSDSVELRADEIESGTTVRVEFQTIFVGGTDEEEINAGEIDVDFETEGGTEGSETFVAPTDVSSSADNRIASLQSEIDSLENWRLLGIGGSVFGVIMLLIAIVVYRRSTEEESDKPPGSEATEEESGGPPV